MDMSAQAPERTDPVVVQLNCEATERSDTETIDRAEWNAMTRAQRYKRVQEMAADNMNNAGGYGWHIEDPDDYAAVGEPPLPINVDQALRLVFEYGNQRAAAATAAANGRNTEATSELAKADKLYDQIGEAITR